eukprot:4843203-Pleurochrysis_carterae.AAC.1
MHERPCVPARRMTKATSMVLPNVKLPGPACLPAAGLPLRTSQHFVLSKFELYLVNLSRLSSPPAVKSHTCEFPPERQNPSQITKQKSPRAKRPSTRKVAQKRAKRPRD